jgi:hypothetical protein
VKEKLVLNAVSGSDPERLTGVAAPADKALWKFLLINRSVSGAQL